MLEIQKFLRSHDPRSALRHAQEKWGIECYQDGPLVALNYSQIDSPRGVPEVEECRGLILEDLTWNVVAMPYRRFYNYSENPYAAKCNLETSVLFDKLDGSLVSIYYYDKWRAATRSRPNADGGLNKSSSTFSSLIWDTFHNQGIDLNRLSTKMTYIFELIGPDNRVVTPYEKAKLVLTGARCMTGSYEEVSFEELKQLSEYIEVPLAMSLPFKDANHQEHWTATDTLDGSITISKSSFDDFKARLGGVVTTETPYKDNFHHGDRNVYVTYNTTKVVIPVQSRRTWENRVKHCPSVFQFPKVPADVPVFAYPEARDHYQSNRLLGTAVAAIPILEWDKMNAVLGPNKKVNVIMVGFGDKDESIAHWQEAAWFGGKKNDVVICYGGPNDKPTWTYVFGWTEQEIAKKNLQSLVLEGPVDATILPKVTTEIRANYVIKDWKKFNYLTVEPPVWIFPVFLVIMVLAQAGYYIWAFSNDLHKK